MIFVGDDLLGRQDRRQDHQAHIATQGGRQQEAVEAAGEETRKANKVDIKNGTGCAWRVTYSAQVPRRCCFSEKAVQRTMVITQARGEFCAQWAMREKYIVERLIKEIP